MSLSYQPGTGNQTRTEDSGKLLTVEDGWSSPLGPEFLRSSAGQTVALHGGPHLQDHPV